MIWFKTLINAIPFNKNEKITILELGCGTGNITKCIKETFPNSHCTCLDLAENMIKISKHKLKNYNNISFKISNFNDFDF